MPYLKPQPSGPIYCAECREEIVDNPRERIATCSCGGYPMAPTRATMEREIEKGRQHEQSVEDGREDRDADPDEDGARN